MMWYGYTQAGLGEDSLNAICKLEKAQSTCGSMHSDQSLWFLSIYLAVSSHSVTT